eukprot:352901-Chlamydomonas_euryale.AAC.9
MGCKIINEGDKGDLFYIIKEGEAVVYQNVPNGKQKVNHLFKADFFGERALLCEEPRVATVEASTQMVLLTLKRDTFTEILGPLENLMAREKSPQVVAQKMAKLLPRSSHAHRPPGEVLIKRKKKSRGSDMWEVVRAKGHLDEVQELRKGGSTLTGLEIFAVTAVAGRCCFRLFYGPLADETVQRGLVVRPPNRHILPPVLRRDQSPLASTSASSTAVFDRCSFKRARFNLASVRLNSCGCTCGHTVRTTCHLPYVLKVDANVRLVILSGPCSCAVGVPVLFREFDLTVCDCYACADECADPETGKDSTSLLLTEGQVLGGGAFSRVSIVTEDSTGRTYALKRMRKSAVVQCPEHVFCEQAITKNVAHPFCIRQYASFQVATGPLATAGN